jgi:hypothetical protein
VPLGPGCEPIRTPPIEVCPDNLNGVGYCREYGHGVNRKMTMAACYRPTVTSETNRQELILNNAHSKSLSCPVFKIEENMGKWEDSVSSWATKLKARIHSYFHPDEGEPTISTDPNRLDTEQTRNVESQLMTSGLTPEEIRKLRGGSK